MANQVIELIAQLGTNLEILSQMTYSGQTTLADVLNIGQKLKDDIDLEKEFYNSMDGFKFTASVAKAFVNKWKDKVPSVGEVAKVFYPFLVDTYNVFADAELLVARSTNNELAEVKRLSNKAYTLANAIHTTSTIIKNSYGPIIDYDEINQVLSGYVGKGFHITDYSKTIKDYEDEIANLRIVEHKLSALVEKLEQGGCSVKRERSAHLQK